jgi:hypothetical protein
MIQPTGEGDVHDFFCSSDRANRSVCRGKTAGLLPFFPFPPRAVTFPFGEKFFFALLGV